MVVDWNGELETVNGKAVKLKHINPKGGAEVFIDGDFTSRTYLKDGTHYFSSYPNIRNVATPPIPAPIVERMRALIERIGQRSNKYWQYETEARAIMAELAPVDSDAAVSEEILGKIALIWNDPEYMIRQIKDAVTTAIRKGRELEREGRK